MVEYDRTISGHLVLDEGKKVFQMCPGNLVAEGRHFQLEKLVQRLGIRVDEWLINVDLDCHRQQVP
jgi:hypothetical protein